LGAEISMLIEIKDLELHPIDFEEEFRPGELDLGPDLSKKILYMLPDALNS
jgi:hypothetical protein